MVKCRVVIGELICVFFGDGDPKYSEVLLFVPISDSIKLHTDNYEFCLFEFFLRMLWVSQLLVIIGVSGLE